MPRRSILKAREIKLEHLKGKFALRRDNKLSGREYYNNSGWEFVASIDYLMNKINNRDYKRGSLYSILNPGSEINLQTFIISLDSYNILLNKFPNKKQIFDKYKQ